MVQGRAASKWPHLLPCQGIDMHQGSQVDHKDGDGPQHMTVESQDMSICLHIIDKNTADNENTFRS